MISRVFAEAFGDVAREGSVLSLDVSQDLHWIRFSTIHPSPCLSGVFSSQGRLGLEELFIESLLCSY